MHFIVPLSCYSRWCLVRWSTETRPLKPSALSTWKSTPWRQPPTQRHSHTFTQTLELIHFIHQWHHQTAVDFSLSCFHMIKVPSSLIKTEWFCGIISIICQPIPTDHWLHFWVKPTPTTVSTHKTKNTPERQSVLEVMAGIYVKNGQKFSFFFLCERLQWATGSSRPVLYYMKPVADSQLTILLHASPVFAYHVFFRA